jgi:hypothetical protein
MTKFGMTAGCRRPAAWFPSALALMFASFAASPLANAQGETTSAIVGSVTDPSSAAIPGATVTVSNSENGFKRSAKTDDAGWFTFPQLKPGTYAVKVEADRFETRQNNSVIAGLGQKQTVDFRLNIASASETIVVQEQAPLLNPENPNTVTTLSARSIENLPNPGGDMTYPLQFAAGALINTAGSGNDFVGGTNGYGNVQFNGLPSLVERLHCRWPGDQRPADQPEQRPFHQPGAGIELHRRSHREHALLLGGSGPLRGIAGQLRHQVGHQSVPRKPVRTVERIQVQRGRLLYQLHPRQPQAALDGESFRRQPGRPHPAQQAVLLFRFSEWVRIALPIVSATTVPTPAFQSYVLQQLPAGGTDSVTGSTYQPAPQLVPFYQKLFSLYGNTAGAPLPVLGCPFNSDGKRRWRQSAQRQWLRQPPERLAFERRSRAGADGAHRLQHQRENTGLVPVSGRHRLQAAYTDPINPGVRRRSPAAACTRSRPDTRTCFRRTW